MPTLLGVVSGLFVHLRDVRTAANKELHCGLRRAVVVGGRFACLWGHLLCSATCILSSTSSEL